ncbi:hypothetical protein HFP57_06750 [Parasphingopyxis algicola]|uniref:hypothetical protein n=1 Tax=Parasphingopyxis algicola TaxID=2026624 RepID=UPI0015A39FF0|nr:hypothetical protein [Parasphingopyxis algicola]QLC24754.1 hypothetical protein HFP57_06750 [Parasphingopyxis algicola]
MTIEPISAPKLHQNEGLVLVAIWQHQPVPVRDIAAAVDRTAAGFATAFAPALQDVVDSLLRHRLVEEKGTLGTQSQLACTRRGVRAIHDWARNMGEADLLSADSVRMKILAFDLLCFEERIGWIAHAEAAAYARLEDIRLRQGGRVPKPQAYSADLARRILEARIEWLRSVKFDLVADRTRRRRGIER